MPIIGVVYGIIITMNWNDHNPPHIHIRYAEHLASMGLDGELLAGTLPKKQLRIVQAWLEIHIDTVRANWELARAKETLIRIDTI